MWWEIHGTAIGLPWQLLLFFLFFQIYKIIFIFFLKKKLETLLSLIRRDKRSTLQVFGDCRGVCNYACILFPIFYYYYLVLSCRSKWHLGTVGTSYASSCTHWFSCALKDEPMSKCPLWSARHWLLRLSMFGGGI